jgi:hypothetical protein
MVVANMAYLVSVDDPKAYGDADNRPQLQQGVSLDGTHSVWSVQMPEHNSCYETLRHKQEKAD